MKSKLIFLSFLFLIIINSCSKEVSDKKISFYHWKVNAEFSNVFYKAIENVSANKIYLHYFDIEALYETNWNSDGIFPTYVLKEVANEYKNFDIVPVIYIANNIFSTKKIDLKVLSDRIRKLINQISLRQFNKEIKKIQVDCDWTESTKNAYFELLKKLQDNFEIDVTIRLHQIKFKDIMGIPPTDKGTLMLYNVGDLKNTHQNSILEKDIINEYINTKTSYPLQLNIGLPIYSQTVISNNENKVKIIKGTTRTILENDIHFKKIDEMNFQIVKDTLFRGFYLSKGYNLKLDEIKESEIIDSYHIIKDSKLQTDQIIFYHLDENSLKNIDLKKLTELL